MFYYKFNLLYPSTPWFGSKACKKKNFFSPQWLRNTKQKKYPLWRFDIIFSKKKYYSHGLVEGRTFNTKVQGLYPASIWIFVRKNRLYQAEISSSKGSKN